ncbi:MAG: adenylate cyclase [Acidobacteriota bacterium]|jgi:adenylate cyclase|nr:adenylate cyclase [Acidobacteriota bacterium]
MIGAKGFPMLRLRFLIDGEARTFALSGSRVRLGRGSDNEVVLPDVSVSRHHAELRRGEEGWSIHDLMSTNGIEVNRMLVKAAPLEPGDRLGVGVFELVVEDAGGITPDRATPALPTGRTVAPESDGLASIANATIIRPLADFAADYGLAQPAGPGAGTSILNAGVAASGPAPAPHAAESGDGYANRMFGFLTRLGQVLITADSIDEVLARMLDIAFQALPVERGFILLRDDSEELVCELARVKDQVQLRPTAEVPVSRTMLKALMRERVALVTYDAMSDQRLSGGESIRLHQIRAAMCAPLWSGVSIIGVVQLDSPFKVGAFNERDLDFLTALANYVAVAVERIRYAKKADRERQVRSRLERYHSPAVIEEVLREDEPTASGEAGMGAGLGLRRPRAAEASVLFADLVGFTSFSEKARPEEVADLLDAFLSLAVEAIFEVSGTLDKFIGDCVMAFFGAPVPQADHALRAVRAAVEIQRRLSEWGVRRAEMGLPAWQARVAVNSGPVVVGDIGSRRRVDYTVLGNTVKVAARLEAFVARPGDVVLGPETHRLLGGAIATEPLGDFQLKGLERKIVAWRVSPEVLVPGA